MPTKFYPTPRIDRARKSLANIGARSLRYTREKIESAENGLDNISFEIFAIDGRVIILEGIHPRNEGDADGVEIFKPVCGNNDLDETIDAAITFLTQKRGETT